MGDVLLLDRCDGSNLYLHGFTGKPEELIALLQFYQNHYGYISKEGVQKIASFLKVSEAHIYGVASFYSQFRFVKPGENLIRICLGTACHVQGGEQLSQEIQTMLGIGPGETTPDQSFEFQEVACLGCCAQAPVVEINGKIYGKMTRDQVQTELRKVMEKHEAL